jgi:hypothetical protein
MPGRRLTAFSTDPAHAAHDIPITSNTATFSSSSSAAPFAASRSPPLPPASPATTAGLGRRGIDGYRGRSARWRLTSAPPPWKQERKRVRGRWSWPSEIRFRGGARSLFFYHTRPERRTSVCKRFPYFLDSALHFVLAFSPTQFSWCVKHKWRLT